MKKQEVGRTEKRMKKQEKLLYGFGVASLDEAREIREVLGAKGRRTRVMALSGAAGWSEEKGQFCERFGLTPTIVADEAFLVGQQLGKAERVLPVEKGLRAVHAHFPYFAVFTSSRTVTSSGS